MGSCLVKCLKVEVKNGDAVANNRMEGRSNTGTYYLCKTDTFHEIEDFFNAEHYFLDYEKILAYIDSFLKRYEDLEYYMSGIMDLNINIERLNEFINFEIKGIETRVNDVRVFLKFKDNNESLIKIFRNILFGEYSRIVFELENNICKIYPEIWIKND